MKLEGFPTKGLPIPAYGKASMGKNLILIALILSMFTSCSSMQGDQSEPVDAVVQEHVTKVHSIESAEKEMDALTDKAIKSSQESRDYLATDLYIKANDASLRGDSATAAFLFKYVHKLAPEDLYLKKKYAIELIRVGQLMESKTFLEEIFVEEKFEDETTGLILGGVYTAMDQSALALKTYEKVVKFNPKSEEACVFLGKAYALDDKYKKAIRLLNKCQKRMPNNGIFAYYLGKINLNGEKRSLAMRDFKNSLKQDPSFYQSAVALGLLYEEKEKFAKAKNVYEKFLVKNPTSYPVLTRIVQLKFATDDYKNIIDYAQRLSSLDSDDLNLKVRLGILYTDKKRYSDAIGIFKEVLVAMPDSDKVLYYLGSLYLQTEQFEVAIGYFNKIESQSALFHDSHIQMAQILSAMALDKDQDFGRFEKFVKTKSEKHEELAVELKIMLASYHEEKKDFAKAIVLVNEVRKKKAYTENHDYYLASLYEKERKFEESRVVIEKLLAKNPKNAHALNFLGYSLLEQNTELDKAFAYIRKAVDLKPEDGFIRDSLGWYYYKTGNLEMALVEVKKAWELVQTDVVITKHLAIIYQELKKYGQAKKYYNEALKHCKVQSETDEVMKAISNLESLRLPASEK
jgi:tetratricopeptide (TPR) repeat protein